MKSLALLLLVVAAFSAGSSREEARPGSAVVDSLLKGNRRYVADQAEHPRQGLERRQQAAAGQKPTAVVVACADSRVAPEIILDQGLGDLFVVRTAGNIVGDIELGSIEYAVEHLGAKTILVLGHERCGAVAAAVGSLTSETAPEGHIGHIVHEILPAVGMAKSLPGDQVDNTVRTNAKQVARKIARSKPILAHAVHEGLRVLAARYDLDSGVVEVLHEVLPQRP